MKFSFGDIVVVDNNFIGVVVKVSNHNSKYKTYYDYFVYVRHLDKVVKYSENKLKRCICISNKQTTEELVQRNKNMFDIKIKSLLEDYALKNNISHSTVVRACNCLKSANICSLKVLSEMSLEQIRNIRYLGKRAYLLITNALLECRAK